MSDPDADPCTWNPDGGSTVGAASTAGGYSRSRRKVNQDRFGCTLGVSSTALVVCDGHGDDGEAVSTLVRDASMELASLLAHSSPNAVCRAIDARVRALGSLALFSGCTMVLAVDVGDAVHVVNVGDSRAIGVTAQGRARPLSKDHKPDEPSERARIEQAGGTVTMPRQRGGVPRVGGLALSRAFGDLAIASHGVISEGELVVARKSELQFVVLVSDGVVDVMGDDELALAVHELAALRLPLAEVALRVVSECRERWWDMTRETYCDDVTCAIRRVNAVAADAGAPRL